MSLSKHDKIVELNRLLSIESRLIKGGITADDILFTKKKADEGLPRAQFVYAHILTCGIVTAPDYKTARHYMELAVPRAGHDVLNQIADLYFIQGDLQKFQETMDKVEVDLRAFDAEED